MGYNRISPRQKTRLQTLVNRGMSIRGAAEKVGVSHAWAYQYMRALNTEQRERDQQKQDAGLAGPVPYDQLCAEAKQAYDDFEYFRRRYFGHLSRPWMVEAAYTVLESYRTPDREYGAMNVSPGAGKALALDTPLPTPTGWTTMKDVEPGDLLLDEQGHPCRVTFKSDVFYDHDCYQVRTDDGATVIADADHLWPVRVSPRHAPKPGRSGPKATPGGVRLRTSADLAKRRSKRPRLQVAASLNLPAADLLIDPYVLGAWLGDGDSNGARIVAHPDDAPHMIDAIHAAGYTTSVAIHKNLVHVGFSEDITTCPRGHDEWSPSGNCRPCNTIAVRARRTGEQMPPTVVLTPAGWLRRLDLLGNKHIPSVYLRGSHGQRLALLQGLIDTDGHVSPTGHVEFTTVKRRLALDVLELVHSLGVKASVSESRATLYGRDCGPKYRLHFYMADAARLPRKARLCRNGVRTPGRYLTVTPCESVPTQCLQVDSPSHLYLAGDGFLVTHNTTLVHDIAAWLTVRDRTIRGLMGSATQSKAEKMLGRLRRNLERTVPARAAEDMERLGLAVDAQRTLSQDFGLFRPPDKTEPWRSDALMVVQFDFELVTEKEHTWTAYGLDVDYLGDRINLALWDDATVPKDLTTLEKIESKRRNFDTIAESRIEPGGALWLIGQRIGANDLYRHALDKPVVPDDDDTLDTLEAMSDTEREAAYTDMPRKYRHVVYKAHSDATCAGLHKTKSPPQPEGCLLDPVRLPWRELRTLKHNDPSTYQVWYQQEDTDLHDTLVKKVWVSGGTDPETGTLHYGCWDTQRGLCELPANLAGPKFSIVTIDPSPTRFWGIQWYVATPQADGQVFLMDLFKGKLRADELLEWRQNEGIYTGLMNTWQERSVRLGWPITHWVIERNGAQRFLLQYDFIRRWCSMWRTNIVPHDTTSNKHDPDYGVYILREPWRTARVRLPGRGPEARMASMKLVDEVQRYPHSWTTDQVMAQWFLFAHLPHLARQTAPDVRLERPSWIASLPDARPLSVVPA